MALAIAVVEFAISLLLLRGFDTHAAGYQFEEIRAWIPQPPIHYHLGVDGISLFLVLLTTFLTPSRYWRHGNRSTSACRASLLPYWCSKPA